MRQSAVHMLNGRNNELVEVIDMSVDMHRSCRRYTHLIATLVRLNRRVVEDLVSCLLSTLCIVSLTASLATECS